MKTFPSIFNDVIGPVMRGPSSSHSAAALRIGRISRDLMEGKINHTLVEYDPNGSLVTTHKSQGSDMGLFGGLLGWETNDERLPDFLRGVDEAGLKIDIKYLSYGAKHPNNYQLTLTNDTESHTLSAISTGGGMIVIEQIDGAEVSMSGDYFETLVYLSEVNDKLLSHLQSDYDFDDVGFRQGDRNFIEIKSAKPVDQKILDSIAKYKNVEQIKVLNPVLTVLSRKDLAVPFITAQEMLTYNEDKNLSLWELAVDYESMRSGLAKEVIFEKMRDLSKIMQAAIKTGLAGTKYKDRILPSQSPNFKKKMDAKELVEGDVLNTIIMSVSAIMEVKSSMGVIIAAPTAGSCASMPGAVLGLANSSGMDEDAIVQGLLVAGLIGVFIAEHATFAAEVGGCMAECGSASGMSAAAIVTMKKGSIDQALAAASIALQNSFGMICDPIANRVEAPCLGKNTMAAVNALSSANMGLAGYLHLIPLDEVIDAMKKVGDQIPNELCCTNKGGLSITPTAKSIETIGIGKFRSC